MSDARISRARVLRHGANRCPTHRDARRGLARGERHGGGALLPDLVGRAALSPMLGWRYARRARWRRGHGRAAGAAHKRMPGRDYAHVGAAAAARGVSPQSSIAVSAGNHVRRARRGGLAGGSAHLQLCRARVFAISPRHDEHPARRGGTPHEARTSPLLWHERVVFDAPAGCRNAWLQWSLRNAPSGDARGIVHGVIGGLQRAFGVPEALARTSAPAVTAVELQVRDAAPPPRVLGAECLACFSQWRNISPAGDWAAVINSVVTVADKYLRMHDSRHGLRHALSIVQRLCTLHRGERETGTPVTAVLVWAAERCASGARTPVARTTPGMRTVADGSS